MSEYGKSRGRRCDRQTYYARSGSRGKQRVHKTYADAFFCGKRQQKQQRAYHYYDKKSQKQQSCRSKGFEYFVFLRARQNGLAQTHAFSHKFSADFFSPQILYIKLRFFAMILTLMEGKRGEIGQILNIYNYLQRKIPKNGCFLQTILILYNY